jgi:hypothetical protein
MGHGVEGILRSPSVQWVGDVGGVDIKTASPVECQLNLDASGMKIAFHR